jgi:hypothetical protein
MPYSLDIPGQVSAAQLRAIELVASLVPPDGCVVEVGSLFGRSSWAWGASVDPTVEVHCIDPWEGNVGVRSLEARHGVTYGLEQFVAYTRHLPNIHPHKGYSPRDFRSWDRPIDLYYEDAVHTDPILASNLEFWTSHLRDSGIVCGDDYRPRFPDVKAGAKRLADRLDRELIVVENFWCLLPTDAVCPGAARIADRLRGIARESDAERRARGFVLSMGPRQGMPKVTVGSIPSVSIRASNESLDEWPLTGTAGGNLQATVHVFVEGPRRQRVAEKSVPLAATSLQPDMPLDFELELPTAQLPPGPYLAVFGLLDSDGQAAAGREPETAAGATFEILLADPDPTPLPVLPTPAAALSNARPVDERRPLIDHDVVRRDFTSAVFADSHGAFEQHLGAGLLYYALAQAVRAQVAVCIGSGGGFVPSLLRRAQIDAGIKPSRTYLIDANLGELAFGSPVQQGGWMTEENQFLHRESDIVVLTMLSRDAAQAFASQGLMIDYLHVDGDHSTSGVLADLADFLPLLSDHAVVSLHDLRMPSVGAALAQYLESHPRWALMAFPEVGAGTALMRRTASTGVARRPQSLAEFVDVERRVDLNMDKLLDAVRDSQHRSRFERWDYLTSTAYRLRYDIVAGQFDDPGATVVEVGGFPNSILGSLRQAARVFAVEPYAPDEFVRGLEQRGRDLGVPFFLRRGSIGDVALRWSDLGRYRLLALGFDLTSGAPDEEGVIRALIAFARAVVGAEKVAIEVPGYAPSALAFEALESLLIGRKELDIVLDLSKDPVAEQFHVKDSRALRRLVIFEPCAGLDVDGAALRASLMAAAGRVHVARLKEDRATAPPYHLGETIRFTLDGNARPYLRQGWVGAEPRHTWTQGNSSRIVLPLDEASGAPWLAGCRMLFSLRPLVARETWPSQRLVIRVNGHEVHSGRHDRETTVEADIPPRALAHSHHLVIDLEHPDARRPAELLAGSRDQKLLAFAATELTIKLPHDP